ncbi:MAG: glucosamine-6-phosphate deaminase [Firmicutes bacterium]|nr:glucosamine-6-phosphate deaminase [Bacillota bacterium]
MRIYLVDDYEKMSKKAATIVASQMRIKPDSVLGLATGSTPEGMYKELVKMHKKEDLDFSEIKTFNLDEYYGLPKDNRESYYFYMMNNLFNHINIKKGNINIPNGMEEDIKAECIRYEEEIEKAGGIDLQVLGIGRNGHIGFNEPNLKFEALTHLVKLDEDTITANSRFFDSLDEVPTKAISMGIKTIMHSRKILLLANGKEKALAIKKALEGPIKPEVPASILQLHIDVTVIIDKEASKELNLEDHPKLKWS